MYWDGTVEVSGIAFSSYFEAARCLRIFPPQRWGLNFKILFGESIPD